MTKRKSRRARSLVKNTIDLPPAPSEEEREAIAQAHSRVCVRRPRFRFNAELLRNSNKIAAPHSDQAGWEARFQDAFGTRGRVFATAELGRLLRAATLKGGEIDSVRLESLVAAIDGARPQNELEAMILSQLALTHSLAMDFLVRAKNADQVPQLDSEGRMATKLMLAFAGHVELLDRLRRGGSQTMRVEHVHVHAGGQAVVGLVAPRGGGKNEIERQPHAPVALPSAKARHSALDQSSEVLGQAPPRKPVPIPRCEGQGEMPDARWIRRQRRPVR